MGRRTARIPRSPGGRARTADGVRLAGWTPLFVNAAAIVLEVGGVLQHGALVAREYGKPCVVGVAQATERLRNGTRVEIDGAAAVIRVLDA